MKAMILAAGLGTRLRPLTDTRPKALVEVAGRTLLEITLSRLRGFGIREVIINVHHFAGMVIDYLKANNHFGMRIEVSREDVLLDTGGGLKKAAWFFLEGASRGDSGHGAPKREDEPFLLHNVDVISTIDFRRMLQFHSENRALATLAVQSRESSRYLLFNDQLQLCGRRIAGHDTVIPVPRGVIPSEGDKRSLRVPAPVGSNLLAARQGSAAPVPTRSGAAPKGANCHSERSEESAFSESPAGHPPPLQALAFSGIHVISPRFLPMLTEEGIFSIIDSYLRLGSQGQNILAFRADEYYWRDLGRPSDLSQAALDLRQKILS